MNKKIFISYSHLNIEWGLETGYNLLPWLRSQLKHEGISVWWDDALKRAPGVEYKKHILSKIDEADLAILLISQDYASSSFIQEIEEPRIRARYEKGELDILPLMISKISNLYKNNRLSWIFDLQIFPEATKPLIDIVNDKAQWESVKVDLLDSIYNRLASSDKHKNANICTESAPSSTYNNTIDMLIKASKELREMKVYIEDVENDKRKAIELISKFNKHAREIFDSIKPFISNDRKRELEDGYNVADKKMHPIQIKLISKNKNTSKLSNKDIEIIREVAILETDLRHKLSLLIDEEIEQKVGN